VSRDDTGGTGSAEGRPGGPRDLPGARPRPKRPKETALQRREAERRRKPKPRDPKVRIEGTTPLGDLLAGLLSKKEFAEGMRLGRLARAWPEVVGERLANECRPVRLEAGNLTVAVTSGPWGAQVRFLAGEIQKGANRALGGEPVTRVTVVVDDGLIAPPKPL
jgi:predicted nucleic acid-binding Zn ribbon protein